MYNKHHGHSEWVTTVDIFPNGEIVSGAMDNVVCHWARNVVRCTNLTGHRKSISHVIACPYQKNMHWCLSGSYDTTIRLWDLQNHTCIRIFMKHNFPITSLQCDWRGMRILSCDRKGKMRLWNLKSGKLAAIFKQNEHTGAIMTSCLTEEFVCTGCTNGRLQIIDRHNGEIILVDEIEGSINDIQFEIETNTFVAGGSDKLLRTYCLENGESRILYGHTDVVTNCCWVGNDLIVSSSGDGKILVHQNINEGEILYGLTATKKGGINGIEVAEDCSSLFTVGDDFVPLKFNFYDEDHIYTIS